MPSWQQAIQGGGLSYYTVMLCVCTGLAHVCVVTPCMTITRARIEMSIPRKRKGSCANHDKVFSTVPPWCYPPSPLFSFLPTSTTASFPFLLSSPLHFQPATMLSSIFICRHFKDSMKQLCKLFLDTSDLTVSINSCSLSYSLILRLIETWNGNRFVQSCIFCSSVTL